MNIHGLKRSYKGMVRMLRAELNQEKPNPGKVFRLERALTRCGDQIKARKRERGKKKLRKR